MGNEHGSQFRQGTFPWEVGVKPQRPSARAELPVAKPSTESPRFGEPLMEEVCARHRKNMAAAETGEGCEGRDPRVAMERVTAPTFAKTHGLRSPSANAGYQPQVIRRVEIPNRAARGRKLGIRVWLPA
jgi:hypothetical protein